MIRKILSFALVVGMVVSLAACAPKSTAPVEEIQYVDEFGNTITTTQPADSSNPSGGGSVIVEGVPISEGNVIDASKLKDHVNLSVGWSTASVDLGKDDLGNAIQKMFNASISVEVVPPEVIMSRASADTLPDLLRIDVTSTAFLTLNKSNVFTHINPSWLNDYPLIKKTYDDSPQMRGMKAASSDGFYPGLPYANYPLIRTDIGYAVANFYRDDWARKAGINTDTNPIKTVDDQYALFKALTSTTNGIRYGYGGFTWQFHYIPWVDTYSWVKEDTGTYAGKWVPGFLSQRLKPALQYWNKLFNDKALDPNCLAGTAKSWDLFSQEKLGSSYSNADEYWIATNFSQFDGIQLQNNPSFYANLKDLYGGRIPTAEDVLKEIPPLALSPGQNPVWCARPPEVQTTCINAKVGSDQTKVQRILMIYEWLYSPDGIDFMRYGFKGDGKNWQKNAQGQAVRTLPESKTISGAQMKIWELYPSTQFRQIAGIELGWNTPEATSIYPEWITKHVIAKQAEKNAVTSPLTTEINLLRSPAYDTANGTQLMNEAWYEPELTRVVASKPENFEGAWKAFTDKCNSLNAGTLIDEINAKIKEKGLG